MSSQDCQKGKGRNAEKELHWLGMDCKDIFYLQVFFLLDGVVLCVNLRPADWVNTPCGFFVDSKKTAARSTARFSPTLSPIFLATFVKVSILGHARSGHQVRSSDHTLQKLYSRAPATVFEGKL